MEFILIMLISSQVYVQYNHQSKVQEPALAHVTGVNISGKEKKYNFNVTIKSPDEGCNQYADWWEVISSNGELLYRRILLHSHIKEQPFTRSGGPVEITQHQTVWIRAHMNNAGYGGKTYKGSVEMGFRETEMGNGFAADLEKQLPQPEGCSF